MPNLHLSGITPHRQLSVTWDKTQNIMQEAATIWRRLSGSSIFPTEETNLEYLKSKVRVLGVENDLQFVHASEDAHQYIIRLEDWRFSPNLVEVPMQRAFSELAGVEPAAEVASTGDWFITKRVGADESWGVKLDDVELGPSVGRLQYPLDYVAMTPTTGVHETNQGYLLRLIIPGATQAPADHIMSFRFGEEITLGGYGKFEFLLTGIGIAVLWEKIAGAWVKVKRWRICNAGDLTWGSSGFTLRILPHAPRWIEFKTFMATGLDPHLGFLTEGTMEQNLIHQGGDTAFMAEAHKCERPANVEQIGSGPLLRPVTGPGRIMVSMRRDLRCYFQVQKLAFKEEGELVDRPFIVPSGVASARLARIRVLGYEPQPGGTPLATITGSLEAADGSALTPASESFEVNGDSTSYTGWNPPGGHNKMRARITLTNNQAAGSRFATPSFEGYEVQRQAVLSTVSLGEKTGGKVQACFITGPSYRPDHESCQLVIEDPTDELPTVRTRRTPVLIETTIDAAGVQKAVLFSGFTGRVTAALQGKHGRTWPREAHRRLDCDLMGQWERLSSNRFTYQQINLNSEASNPVASGSYAKVPWRVTSAIWYFLYSSGFPASALDIPPDPMRFFVSPGENAEDALIIEPGTENLGALAVEFARDYLNQYLIFDGGAGASGAGMWRLLRPPTASTPVLCSFTLAEVPAGKLAHLSASYAPVAGKPVYPVLDADGVEYTQYTVPPRGNVLTVKGRVKSVSQGGQQHFWNMAINRTSWNSPGHTTLGDPTSPDWLGEVRPIEVTDPTLPTQEAVNFMTRRIAEVALRGRRLHQFAAELVLVNVSASETFHSNRPHRPLRPGDPVNMIDMDGNITKCVIHSAMFSIDQMGKSFNQLGYYLLEEFRPMLTLGG